MNIEQILSHGGALITCKNIQQRNFVIAILQKHLKRSKVFTNHLNIIVWKPKSEWEYTDVDMQDHRNIIPADKFIETNKNTHATIDPI